jgi:lysine-specific demethylase/histidyl-hydroxylase NO66
MSLDILIHPHTEMTFLGEIWERTVLHVARNDPMYFAFLRDGLALEELIWQTCHDWGDVSLARAGTDYKLTSFAAQPPGLPVVRRAFADDYTVVINNLEQKNLRVARFCREVEKKWFFKSNVNLYITRPNTQGLDYHYDDQDVFILQLEGAKTWRIYDLKSELPLDDVAYEHIDCGSSAYTEYDLRPGDVLYLPRGFIHEARARDSISVHLTLSVSAIRWASLLQSLVHVLARDHLELRRAVPVELLRTGDLAVAEETVRRLAAQLGSRTHLATAVSELQDRLLVGKPRLPMATALRFGGSSDIGMDTRIGVAADQVCILSKSGDAVVLKFIGASIELSGDLEEPVAFLCRRKTCVVRELPGKLSPEEKLTLVRRLIECELLTIDPSPDVS